MSTASQFTGGSLPPKNLINFCSSAGYSALGRVDARASAANAKQVLSGALTANTLATVLSVTGAGVFEWLGMWQADVTSRTMRMQVTIDGVIAYDATSAASAISANGAIAIGGGGDNGGGVATAVVSTVPFKQSVVIKVASSLAELDKIITAYKYWTT